MAPTATRHRRRQDRPRDTLTNRQRTRLLWLAHDRRWTLTQMQVACGERWRRGLDELTRAQASTWIRELERREP